MHHRGGGLARPRNQPTHLRQDNSTLKRETPHTIDVFLFFVLWLGLGFPAAGSFVSWSPRRVFGGVYSSCGNTEGAGRYPFRGEPAGYSQPASHHPRLGVEEYTHDPVSTKPNLHRTTVNRTCIGGAGAGAFFSSPSPGAAPPPLPPLPPLSAPLPPLAAALPPSQAPGNEPREERRKTVEKKIDFGGWRLRLPIRFLRDAVFFAPPHALERLNGHIHERCTGTDSLVFYDVAAAA